MTASANTSDAFTPLSHATSARKAAAIASMIEPPALPPLNNLPPPLLLLLFPPLLLLLTGKCFSPDAAKPIISEPLAPALPLVVGVGVSVSWLGDDDGDAVREGGLGDGD